MSEMICKREITGGIGLEYEYMPVQELVRCKDCINRGNPKKCLVAHIGDVMSVPYFCVDNNGDFYCADGKRE